jgi:hypothetical protein
MRLSNWYKICQRTKKPTMKTKAFLISLVLFFLVSFLISCSKNNEQIITTDLKPIIEIKSGNLLIVNLGNFGDEEGAWILTTPKNAKESKVQRQVNSSAIQYQYLPLDHFIGKDSVTLILNRGSDGASSGLNDTTKIAIIVR